MSWTPFTYPFNLTRQPAATVPCGLTKAGLPVGLQIIGPPYDDAPCCAPPAPSRSCGPSRCRRSSGVGSAASLARARQRAAA